MSKREMALSKQVDCLVSVAQALAQDPSEAEWLR